MQILNDFFPNFDWKLSLIFIIHQIYSILQMDFFILLQEFCTHRLGIVISVNMMKTLNLGFSEKMFMSKTIV